MPVLKALGQASSNACAIVDVSKHVNSRSALFQQNAGQAQEAVALASILMQTLLYRQVSLPQLHSITALVNLMPAWLGHPCRQANARRNHPRAVQAD